MSDRIHFQAVDLDDWPLPPATFDLIAVFRFLDRRLFDSIRDGLRPGGLVYYSTRHLGVLARYPGANEAFLLRPGELRSVFFGWQILRDEEGAEDARLIARKPRSD
jgi:SAM-dependent methyltransferase